MDRIKVHSKKLDRFTAAVALVFDADFNSLRGITDMKQKFICIYCARKTLKINDAALSMYYRVDQKYMISQLQALSVKVMVDDELLVKICAVESLWKLVTENE